MTDGNKGVGVFVGDGAYIGDGGRTLQRLWEFVTWKMIKNCPGRYIIKHKRSNPVLIDGQSVTSLDTQAFLSAVFNEDVTFTVHDLQSERCQDRVQVVVFRDTGGVITYCKASQGQDGEPQTLYVHTLNTASGLKRKLEGLRLDHVLAQ
ncbi:hypothetical protein Poli38472_002590 [Pythium oligandrum]|uniref:Uncharacterized protein n=1 Tax=Pythium oligandrum TaxID=41045 RepID=A0A8K1CIF7_PYTOL|nr:hypothetical protein Poli38472_002590 [Pythium oligandrum]|eukprot:TMW63649.1 hypothetical protein Poli38472_002590 [Pythium oligandrum]